MSVNVFCIRSYLSRISFSVFGFFFCGINDESEVTRLESFINFVSSVLKKIRFLVKRDRCIMSIAVVESSFNIWLRLETLSRLLRVVEVKFS